MHVAVPSHHGHVQGLHLYCRYACLRLPTTCSDDAPYCDMQRGQCVLHVASGYGYPQMVKTLLQFKAHADCRDEVCPVMSFFLRTSNNRTSGCMQAYFCTMRSWRLRLAFVCGLFC